MAVRVTSCAQVGVLELLSDSWIEVAYCSVQTECLLCVHSNFFLKGVPDFVFTLERLLHQCEHHEQSVSSLKAVPR